MTLGRWDFTNSSSAVSISDDQFVQELRTERRLLEAIDEMRRAIEDVNASSALVEIEPSAFDDFVNDECPSEEYWAEKLSAAHRR
jgi:hypothetical protein